MNKNPIVALFFIVMFSIPQFAHSWGVTGHRVVGAIAQKHLSKKAKKKLRELIGKESLQQWANWPDFIKSDTTGTWTKAGPWHYVNVPGNLDRDAFMAALKNLKGENLYTQIKAMTEQLKNESLSTAERQIALRFLIHFIGDLHQPLHVGREADLGGNRIKVTWFDKETNLHSLWDNSLVDFQQYSYSEYAKTLDILSEEVENALENSSLEDWFYDSYVLANKVYASVPADGKLSYKYNYIFKEDLDRQLLKGGLRLAKLLNDALD